MHWCRAAREGRPSASPFRACIIVLFNTDGSGQIECAKFEVRRRDSGSSAVGQRVCPLPASSQMAFFPSLSLTTSQDRRIAATQELSSLFEKRDNILCSSVPSLPRLRAIISLHFTEPWAFGGHGIVQRNCGRQQTILSTSLQLVVTVPPFGVSDVMCCRRQRSSLPH